MSGDFAFVTVLQLLKTVEGCIWFVIVFLKVAKLMTFVDDKSLCTVGPPNA